MLADVGLGAPLVVHVGSLTQDCPLVANLSNFPPEPPGDKFGGQDYECSCLACLAICAKKNETGLEAMERLRFLASLRLASTAQTEGGGTTITTYHISLHKLKNAVTVFNDWSRTLPRIDRDLTSSNFFI